MPDNVTENTPKKGRGCFFYGAITLALVFIGVVAGIYFGIRKGFLTGVETYTAPAPAPIPRLQISPQEQERLARNLAAQAEQATRPGGPEELALTEQELNVLLNQWPAMGPFSEQIYLRPEGDKLKAQVSVPLDQFELWNSITRKLWTSPGKRYLNGIASFNVGITNGALTLSLADFEANGKNLPEEFIKRAQNQNLASAINTNAQTQQFLQRVEAISVQDGKVRVRFRR
jgi:hypothetical protein